MASFLLRLVLFAVGLVFAASLAAAAVVLLALWLVRTAWARLTGRPVTPFIVRIHPRSGFQGLFRRTTAQPGTTPRAEPTHSTRHAGDVTDVEPKDPRG